MVRLVKKRSAYKVVDGDTVYASSRNVVHALLAALTKFKSFPVPIHIDMRKVVRNFTQSQEEDWRFIADYYLLVDPPRKPIRIRKVRMYYEASMENYGSIGSTEDEALRLLISQLPAGNYKMAKVKEDIVKFAASKNVNIIRKK